MLTVAKDGSGDFTTLSDAIQFLETNDSSDYTEIFVKKGIYKEVVELRKSNVHIQGEDAKETIITYDNYANMTMDDGSKRGTFRSYTMLLFADNIRLSNLTIENSSGFGYEVGQAIALYAEGDMIEVNNCILLGHQDTLFTGPLPQKVKIAGGFTGPTEFAPRTNCRQCYTNCYICGEVDFIFGSATAYFDHCTIYSLNRNEAINSYISAPSTPEGQKYGYVFESCNITGNCPDGTVLLGRPWRDYAKSVFLRCTMTKQINEQHFGDWNKQNAYGKFLFAEYNCQGEGADMSKKAVYVTVLSDSEAAEYTKDKVLATR